MAVAYETLVYKRLKAILLAHAPLTTSGNAAYIRPGNWVWYDGSKTDPDEPPAGNPADYPRIELIPAGRTEELWDVRQRYSDNNASADPASYGKNTLITYTFTVRVTHRDLRIVMNNPVEAAVSQALRRSNAKMSIPGTSQVPGYAWVRSWGISGLTREMGVDESRSVRMRSVFTVTATLLFSSATLLANASDIIHYLATAENSGTLASIMPADLSPVMADDGMAQNGSINRARSPEGQYCRPPDLVAFQNLADIAASRGIPITIEAEGLLRYAYDLWLSNEIECKAIMADVATGLGYWKARQPSVPLWIEHQGQLAQSIAAPRPAYAAFMAWEAGLMSSLISGVTIMAYFSSLDFGAWTADADFYRATMATYYPGKRIKLFASSYLYSGTQNEYVGDAAMQHLVDYAVANDCDIIWWSASTTAPFHPQAFAFLRATLLA